MFSRKVRWINSRLGGDGVTPDSSKMRGLLDIRYNLAKPILHGESKKLLKHPSSHVILFGEINFLSNILL